MEPTVDPLTSRMERNLEVSSRERLRFTCESAGSQSFKANRNKITVVCTLQRRPLLGGGYEAVSVLTRFTFTPGQYSFSRFHDFTSKCLEAFLEGRALPSDVVRAVVPKRSAAKVTLPAKAMAKTTAKQKPAASRTAARPALSRKAR